jgi:hypothetical protein
MPNTEEPPPYDPAQMDWDAQQPVRRWPQPLFRPAAQESPPLVEEDDPPDWIRHVI